MPSFANLYQQGLPTEGYANDMDKREETNVPLAPFSHKQEKLRVCLDYWVFYKNWFLPIAYKNWFLKKLGEVFRDQILKTVNQFFIE
jgi:hypothetical protein